MALQVGAAGGVGCCFGLLDDGLRREQPHGRRRAALRPVRASSSAAAAKVVAEEEGKVRLGESGVTVSKLGIGAWSWGDTTYWNDSEWDDRRMKEAKAAFDASIDNGMTFFDTAEVYGTALMGAVNSESLLGDFIKERQQKEKVEVAVATKFAALPWRFGRGSVLSALKKSLDRLGLSSVELYQLHWPGLWGNEGYLDGLGDAYEQGLVKAVGVSNYNEQRLRDAHARLKKRGVPLASNQVNYSLIYRTPELNGVKAACDELGVTLIAYSPIAQGVLTGKYTPENPPTGPRANTYTPEFLTKLQPLMNRIKEIGGSYGKNPTQVLACFRKNGINSRPSTVNAKISAATNAKPKMTVRRARQATRVSRRTGRGRRLRVGLARADGLASPCAGATVSHAGEIRNSKIYVTFLDFLKSCISSKKI